MTDTTTALEGTGNDTAATTEAQTATTETTAAASASATTTETKAADTTLLGDSGEAADKAIAAPADWPTDWREKLAGDDKKALEQLKRSNSPLDVWKKARSLEQKLSSGEYKRDLPKDAKPEEVAAWRKEQGLPETAKDYVEDLPLPDGVVLGEADKPVVAALAEAAFNSNVDQNAFTGLIAKYYEMQDKVAAERAEADSAFKQKSEDDLRAEFGPEFRPNINAVKNLLAGMPEGAAGNLLTGRFADGTVIGDNPGFIKWLASVSRELNPAATLVPATAGGAGVSDRLSEIRQMRRADPDSYDSNKAVQAEELQLIEIEQKMKNRGKAA